MSTRLGRLRAAAGALARRPRSAAVNVLGAVLVVAGAVFAVWVVRQAVAVDRLASGVGDVVFFGADGRPWFRLDERRRDVPLARIAPSLQQAILATEDRRFYWHPGIDPIGLTRAIAVNLRPGPRREGGSTLTQQLARTLFLSNRRTVGRKAQEAVIAILLELRLSKAQILELYLNRVYLSAGLYGVEALSRAAFGKPAQDVSLAEAALIAGLVQAPSALSPWSNLDGARRRSHVVLARMERAGFISAAQARAARGARLRIRPYPAPLDPQTGNVLAIVGGRDFSQSQFNRASRSRRQPGSAFKPFVYAAALEQGLSPVSEVTGLASLAPQGDEEWTPRNVSDRVDDRLTLRQAFVESNNRAAVALQRRIGARPILRLAGAAGLDDQPDVPSLALGSGLVSPLSLTAAYAAFANGGDAVRPRAILRVLDRDGGIAWSEQVWRQRLLSPEVAFQMVTLMQDVVARGTGTAVRQWVRAEVAGKTGTTNDFKDAWFVGFAPRLVVGVWVGFDRPATIRRDGYGARIALPIWADFVRRAGARTAGSFEPPATLDPEELCRVSFKRPVEGCPVYVEYFKPSDPRPRQLCEQHEGSLRQRARRAVENAVVGAVRGLWNKIWN